MSSRRKLGSLISPRANETDEERRLREALNRIGQDFIGAIDSAINLRTAEGEASRMRALARTSIQDAAMRGMEALAISKD